MKRRNPKAQQTKEEYEREEKEYENADNEMVFDISDEEEGEKSNKIFKNSKIAIGKENTKKEFPKENPFSSISLIPTYNANEKSDDDTTTSDDTHSSEDNSPALNSANTLETAISSQIPDIYGSKNNNQFGLFNTQSINNNNDTSKTSESNNPISNLFKMPINNFTNNDKKSPISDIFHTNLAGNITGLTNNKKEENIVSDLPDVNANENENDEDNNNDYDINKIKYTKYI